MNESKENNKNISMDQKRGNGTSSLLPNKNIYNLNYYRIKLMSLSRITKKILTCSLVQN